MTRKYNLQNRMVSDKEAAIIRARAAKLDGFNMVDPVVDEEWARLYKPSDALNSYYDYFFSGQDIRVYVAELGDSIEFGRGLPIANLAFNVEQQKQPVYGYASYTYDAVMRGTRIVNGQMTLATRYPGYMRDLLTAAANSRSRNLRNKKLEDVYPAGHLTEDDRLINQYWSKNLDASVLKGNTTEWSVHPPFSLIVKYGIQDVSVNGYEQKYNEYDNDNALFHDHNQRLIDGITANPNRLVLEAIELTSVTHQYSPEGEVLAEQYQFFARDIIVPTPSASGPKKNVNVPGSSSGRGGKSVPI